MCRSIKKKKTIHAEAAQAGFNGALSRIWFSPPPPHPQIDFWNLSFIEFVNIDII